MPLIRTYDDAIRFLLDRVDCERTPSGRAAARYLKLGRMRSLLERLGNPHERLPAVHIAGTKGKGSTAVMLAQMLSAAGYRTGLFTSPHVATFEERIRVDGHSPSPERLVELVQRVAGPVKRMDEEGNGPTYFEVAAALAWIDFNDRNADIAVLEVGLGGRLDATNLCRPLVTVITNIGLDHTHVLGTTHERIAREKAGIIKAGVPLVSGVRHPGARRVVVRQAQALEAPLWQLGREIRCEYHPASAPIGAGTGRRRAPSVDVETPRASRRRLPVPLLGEHQAGNAALAAAAVDLLGREGVPVADHALRDGLRSVKWPIRIEVVATRPTVVLDAAHNVTSVEALQRSLHREFQARRRVLVFAATRDKDLPELLRRLLPSFETVVLTQYSTNPRAVPLDRLARAARALTEHPLIEAPTPAQAWEAASAAAGAEDLICATGSFFLAAEMRELLMGRT